MFQIWYEGSFSREYFLIKVFFPLEGFIQDFLVNDMVAEDCSWNLDLFQVWLPTNVVRRIITNPSPHTTAGPDRIVFLHTSLGLFSLKSVLLTDAERLRREVRHDSSCLLCGNGLKDALHTIRDCPAAREVWRQVVSIRHSNNLFSGDLHEWLATNLHYSSKLIMGEVKWSSLFSLLAWRIWKTRNLFIFQDLAWNLVEIVTVSYSWAKQYGLMNKDDRGMNHDSCLRNSLPDNWVFLNIDGVVQIVSGRASIGGMVQDSSGVWILGYNRSLGQCSSLMSNYGISSINW
ncbi:hypothetical protein PVK06_047836 [Gossypium arboreum]|uniref:Reverse transcriptase zinc-binding domain-containing protein n=1 Tax=Gossypium arboreum TaxID=29729 RepID=A0ABR0MEM3_GOSAR|nr:hypothetical protein PVK06_047836 [Gossypium arboreum]